MGNMVMFGMLQLINVILGTLRSICTIKANRHIGMMLNVISFTFYAAVVKMTSTQDLWYVLVVTAITNCGGFYFATWAFDKMQKDKLWRITLNIGNGKGIDTEDLKVRFEKYNIKYTLSDYRGGQTFDVYSYNQHESELVKAIIPKKIKYSVIEIEKTL